MALAVRKIDFPTASAVGKYIKPSENYIFRRTFRRKIDFQTLLVLEFPSICRQNFRRKLFFRRKGSRKVFDASFFDGIFTDGIPSEITNCPSQPGQSNFRRKCPSKIVSDVLPTKFRQISVEIFPPTVSDGFSTGFRRKYCL